MMDLADRPPPVRQTQTPDVQAAIASAESAS